ncbi:MAG: pyruvate carboxylase subunit B [Rickettsiales bacterium]
MVEFNDVTLRDGQQSLLAGRMQQHHMEELAPDIAATGFGMVEVWGGTCYESPLRYKGEDPWANLDALRSKMPKAKLSMLLRGQSLVSRTLQSDETVALFVATAAKHGVNNFRIFDALNDIENLKPALAAVKKAKEAGHDVQAQGTISYTPPVTLEDGSQIHTVADMVAYARELKEAGADTLCIKDMAGLLTPEVATELVQALKTELPEMKLTLHMHATMGQSNASLKAAIEAGVDAIDTACENLANGSGQNSTEEIYTWLKATHPDKAPKLDEEAMARTREKLRSIRPCYAQHETPYRPQWETLLRDAQVPGGMISTMRANITKELKKVNKLDKLDEIFQQALKEMVQVRKDAGYPPLVTPTSQIVMTQAVTNASAFVFSNGDVTTRYRTLDGDFKKLITGQFGKLRGPVAEQLRAKAGDVETTRPAAKLGVDLDAKRVELQEKLGLATPSAVTDEDLLSYVMMPDVGLPFLKHRMGIEHNPHYDAKATPLALPYPTLLVRHKRPGENPDTKLPFFLPRTDVIPPIAIPYVDRMLHDTVEKLRHQSKFITHESEDARAEAIAALNARIAAEKIPLLHELVRVGEFNTPTQMLGSQRALNAFVAARGEQFGVPESALPKFSHDELLTTMEQAARSLGRSRA